MRRQLVVIAGILAIVSAASSPASAASHAARQYARCTNGGARVLAANAQILVARRPDRTTYACLLSNARRRSLGDTAKGEGETTITVRRFVLAGSVVAYNWEYSREEVEEGVYVLDVRRDRKPRGFDALSGAAAPRQGARNAVTSIAVRDDGAVAWIAYNDDVQPARYEVQKADASATAPTLVAAGPDIAPRSLAISGAAIYWQAGGAPQLGAFATG
jgi:hypothetical protein